MIERIKKYFTQKPPQNFWFWAFVTVVIFKYIAPLSLLMIIPFQIGLVAPDVEINYEDMAQKVTNGLIPAVEKLTTAGQTIGKDNPVLAHAIFYVFGYFVYVWYVAFIFLIINLFRYAVYYSFFHKSSRTKRGDK